GLYVTALSSAGEYRATLAHGNVPLLVNSQTVRFEPGYNTWNWDVGGGSMTLRLVGWDQREPALISVSNLSEPTVLGGLGTAIRPGEAPEWVLEPTAFGKYRFKAHSGRKVSKEAKTIVIDEDHLTHTITLEL